MNVMAASACLPSRSGSTILPGAVEAAYFQPGRLLDPLRFKPLVDVGFLEKDPATSSGVHLEKGEFSAVHKSLQSSTFDFEIFHDLFAREKNVLFHV
jgi:hypothetical protein